MYVMECKSLYPIVLLSCYQQVAGRIYIVIRAVFRSEPLRYRGLVRTSGWAADVRDPVFVAFNLLVVHLSLARLLLAAFAGDPASVGDWALATFAVAMRSRMALFFPDRVL